MPPVRCEPQVPVPPPAYHRARRRLGRVLHVDALTLIRCLHLLGLCRLAIQLAHRRCPPPLPAGPGGRPRVYREESLLLLALLRTLWSLSFHDLHDWLVSWPALALACGLPLDAQGQPRVPSPSQQWKRAAHAGAPVAEALLIGARDLIIDSAPILAWRRADPDAAVGHAPHHHPRPLLRGYRVHTLLCRGSGLPLLFVLAPANCHDAPFARGGPSPSSPGTPNGRRIARACRPLGPRTSWESAPPSNASSDASSAYLAPCASSVHR